MNQSSPTLILSPAPRIAVIAAQWHSNIVNNGKTAFIDTLVAHHIPRDRIDAFEVPGSFEIPLYASKLARSRRYEAVVAFGLVVNGGIYRHDFVADAVISGLMRVQLESEVPIISAVLTPRDFHEHEDHQQFFHAHFLKKGAEAAHACLRTIANMRMLNID